MKPTITLDDPRGRHNIDPGARDRMIRSNTYKDLSTIMLVVSRGIVPLRIVQSWLNLCPPINQKFMRMFVEGMEVGEGYNVAIEQILAHPELAKFKYLLTLEEDNAPPPDGLLKLYESIGKFDVVGGLYWTKGIGGVCQAWGTPHSIPKNYAPFIPPPNSLTEVNGTGMGFTLFKMSIFKNPKLDKPYFKTTQEYIPGQGVHAATQDLHFAGRAAKIGVRFAVDSRVLVGHWDQENQIMW